MRTTAMMMHVLLIAVVIGSLLEIRGFLYKNIRTASYSSRTSSKTSMQLDSFHADFSIIDRSMSCLDFQIILDNLQNLTVTSAARERCRSSFSNDVAEVQKEYALVSEMLNRIHDIPLRSKMNVWPIIKAIEDNSSPPDKEDLSLFARDMEEIIELQSYLESQIVDDRMLLYLDLAEEMSLPEELKNEFTNSFDDEENLNPEKYPAIKVLVKQINSLKSKIVQTIQSLLSSQEMKEKIADSGYTELEGRYCIMLKNTYKKGVGIVHGSSNTGRTIYVEPIQVVEPTNEMKSLQAQLRVEENKILFDMCKTIYTYREEIRNSLNAVAQVDLYRAKARLGVLLNGQIPEVKREGTIQCSDAKHPILVLREELKGKSLLEAVNSKKGKRNALDAYSSKIVGNDIELNNDLSALVISGPNAGGKTIVLKTCGLFALMAKFAIPLPASKVFKPSDMYGTHSESLKEKPLRVDLFDNIMADIGDLQTVSGDLSTFSGHLFVLRQMIQTIEGKLKENNVMKSSNAELSNALASSEFDEATFSLVLLDEIGTGTDPAQGAALAQAVLEDLLDCNAGVSGKSKVARIMVTTHYQRIKELAAHDERFRIAAMQFINNKPTYKLCPGFVGESYALEAAKRMDLPSRVLSRAEVLLDDESKRLVALQMRLEEETNKAREMQELLNGKITALVTKEQLLQKSRNDFEDEIEKFRLGKTEEYLKDLKEKERELEQLLVRARDVISMKDTPIDYKKELNIIRSSLREERVDVEKGLIQTHTTSTSGTDKAPPVSELVNGEPIEVGAELIVLEKGNLFGSRGLVTQRNKGRGRVLLKVGGVEVKIERHLLGKPQTGLGSNSLRDLFNEKTSLEEVSAEKKLSAKDRRMLQMLEEELVDPDKLLDTKKKKR